MNRFCITKQFFHNVYYLIPVELQPKFLRLVEFEKIANGSEKADEIYRAYHEYILQSRLEDISFIDPKDEDGIEIGTWSTGLIIDNDNPLKDF